MTYGIGDRASECFRGWARLLTNAIAGLQVDLASHSPAAQGRRMARHLRLRRRSAPHHRPDP